MLVQQCNATTHVSSLLSDVAILMQFAGADTGNLRRGPQGGRKSGGASHRNQLIN